MMTATMDLLTLADRLCVLFPALPAHSSVRFVGEGFGSYVVSVDERWIFRIARNVETTVCHRRELAMLPLLRDHLPLPIPEPCFHSGPTEVFPYGLIGYPMLSGVPWTLDMTGRVDEKRIARQLAELLSVMHAFPVKNALCAGIKAEEPHTLINDVLPALPHHLDAVSLRGFQAWRDHYKAHPERYAYAPRVLHGDLWCENILLAQDLSHIVGVIDFEQMRIGDPVSELAAMRYVGDGFIDSVRARYRVPGELEPHYDDRLRAAVILRELGGLRYALRYPESEELDDAVEKVSDVLKA